MSDTQTNAEKITLQFPIKDGAGKVVKVLNMRRAKVKDQREITKMTGDDAEAFEIQLFARLCGVTIEDIEELDMLDYAEIQARFRKILTKPKADKPSNATACEVV